jgi:3-oxoacyl-[acyl-carrier-protein] synthase II
MSMSIRRRVVITGYGALSAMGTDSAQIWGNIVQKRLGYRAHTFDDPRIKAKFFGFIDPDQLKQKYKAVPKSMLRMLSDFARFVLVSSQEAVAASFGEQGPLAHYSPLECGVIIGTGWGGLDSANNNNNTYRNTRLSSPFTTLMAMNNAATAAVMMHYGLRGYQSTPVAACASGAIAIGEAVEVIRRGRARFMLAGGTESLKELFNVWSIDILEALSKEQNDPAKACCPFSLDRSGFVLSEGAAVVCLEEYESARSRGAPILAEVTAYQNYSDAHDFTAPAPDLKGRVQIITDALAEAGKAPSEVSYINAHGTSTPLNDLNESQSLKAALGKDAYRIPISSTKSYSGHLIGAAGSMETIFCVKAIENNFIPATIHLDRPDPECDLDYTPNEHRTGVKVDTCLTLSFGFGGSNAALVINRV